MKEKQENNIRYGLVGKYKFQSIFVRNLSFLLIYSSVLLIAMFLYNSHIMRKNVEQRLAIRSLGILEKTQESIDRELQNLSNQIMQLSRDEYITAEMTAPNIKNATRNYDIVYQLQAVSAVNDLVSAAFLYVPTDDTFFSSEGVAVDASLYTGAAKTRLLIEKCRELGSSAGEQMQITIGDMQYLLLNAPYFYDRVLGVLAFQLDSEYLSSLIEGESNAPAVGNTIWTYDENGLPLFMKYLQYPEGLEPEEVNGLQAVSREPGGKSGDYYKRVSKLNGWQYLLSTDADLFSAESVGLDKSFLIILVILSVFCVAFSVYLSRSVYLPIQRVIRIAKQEETEKTGETKNEIELLEQSVSYTVNRNQEMKDFLQTIRPSMISDTFRNILAGHEIEKQKIDEIFSVLKTEFSTELNYSLGLIALIPEEEDFSSVECNILFHRIEQEILAFSRGRFLCSFVHMLQNNNLAVVMGVPDSVSVSQMKAWHEEIHRRIQEFCGDYPVRCVTGASKYLADITELYKVFVEICHELNYRIYLQDHKAEEKKEIEKQFVLQILSRLKESIDNGTEEEISAGRVTRELLQQKGTQEERKRLAVQWWEAVMELLIPLNVFEKDELNLEKENLFAVLEDEQKFLLQLEQFNEKVINGMKASSGRLKKRYVERAKQYIEEHYSDSDLSLSAISDILGISQSYMSSQFKKETGTNFLEYLNRYRIERSRLLLQMTEMTVEEVGFKTGFSSAKNFARVFKKYTDISPGAYREEQKGKQHY